MLSSKEFTVFVVDCSSYMAGDAPGTKKSRLDTGLQYFYDLTANLLLKNRKLDRIGLMVHGDDAPLFEDGQFTYANLKQYSRLLLVKDEIDANLISSIYASIDLFKPKVHLKFSRSLVIITDEAAQLQIDDKFDEYTSFIRDHNINVIFVGNCLGNSKLLQIVNRWNGKLIENVDQLVHYSTALKKVSPRPICSTQLRLGADIENPDDKNSLGISIQVYPATRTEKLMAGHEYVIDSGKVEPIKRQTKYFIKQYKSKPEEESKGDDAVAIVEDDDSDEENYDKIEVNAAEYVPAYKISKVDVQAVTDDLKQLSKLPTTEALDVLGFVKYKSIPFAYFVNESSYVLPSANDTTWRNSVAFNTFAKTLIDFEAVAIVRFVPSDQKDVSVCALLPNVLQIKQKHSYSFVMIQLAFKEDEKFGKFPWLTEKKATPQEKGDESENEDEAELEDDTKQVRDDWYKKEYPTNETINLMDAFVQANDLDADNKPEPNVVTNQKLALVDTQFLNLPLDVPNTIDSKLLASSPAIQKFHLNVKKIIRKSLDKSSLFDFLNEDKFVEKYLVEETSNLFNLQNILKTNTNTNENWLQKNDQDIVQKLIKSLKVKYVTKEESNKKRKLEKEVKLEETNLEKSGFAEYFDVDELLGNS